MPPLFTTKPQQVLAVLADGPLTWHMLLLKLGYGFAPSREDWGWWRRLWNRKDLEHSACINRTLEQLMADLCQVGLVVCLGDKPKDGPWTLPGRCPTCHGSGQHTRAARPSAEAGAAS